MSKISKRFVLFAFIFFLFPSVALSAYNGPPLKIPMPSGGGIEVTTAVNGSDTHDGNDYYSLDFNDRFAGDKVLAAAAGVVETVVNTGCSQWGVTCKVQIRHYNGYITRYLHFANGSIGVSAGDHVIQGQVLGTIGTTGDSSGTHLHFEVKHKNSDGSYSGAQTDPTLSGVTLEEFS